MIQLEISEKAFKKIEIFFSETPKTVEKIITDGCI